MQSTPDAKINIPTILIIMGATGDLMSLKIAPALFHLYQKKKLPNMFKVIGFARRQWTDDFFHEHITESIKKHLHQSMKENEIATFAQLFSYHRGDFDQIADYKNLNALLKIIDDEWGVCSNKLFYLATSPFNYEAIVRKLASSKLTRGCGGSGGWTRVIVEKPFGTNLKDAQHLDQLLARLFHESQIYRIDHYLGKEVLQNILSFRFSNNLFEQNWDNRAIEKIRVRALEHIGVAAGRGAFYDQIGALRDFGQNHLLQMLALVTMEHPMNYRADSIREKRAALLRTLKVPTQKDIIKHTFRAQYQGYHDVQGVSPESQTETYFHVRLALDLPRWKGVPIFLESGKALKQPRKEIMLTFRHPSPCLCPASAVDHYKNRIIFRLEPKEEILITFWAKKPGLDFEMEEQVLRFEMADSTGHSLEAHEKLLADCITGDQTLFVSTDEIISMWRFIDPITRAWEKGLVPLTIYQPGSVDIRTESAYIERD